MFSVIGIEYFVIDDVSFLAKQILSVSESVKKDPEGIVTVEMDIESMDCALFVEREFDVSENSIDFDEMVDFVDAYYFAFIVYFIH